MRRHAAACSLFAVVCQSASAQAQSGYEDRLIDGGTLRPDISDEVTEYDASGWPRAIRIEGVKTVIRRNGVAENEDGVAFGGLLETPSYGALTIDGLWRTDGRASGTFWQRALPISGGWRVNNGLGVLNTPAIELTRTQPRFFLPSTPVAGLSTEWINSRGLVLNAGGGEPGIFDGIRLPVFDRLDGSVATAGAQLSPARGWLAGVQVNHADDVPLGFGPLFATTERISATSIFSGASWQGANARVQGNVLVSERRDASYEGTRVGGWIDAEIQDGRFGHNFGAFRLDRDLTWGNQLISSDAQGAYYRLSYGTRQLLLDGGIDRIWSISGDGPDVTFGTASARYQYARDLAFGAGTNVLYNDGAAYSAFTYVDRSTHFGVTRAQLDYAQDSPERDVQLTIDQTWNMSTGQRLSTAVSFGRATDSNGITSNRIGFGFFGGIDLTSNLSIDGNARWNSSTTYSSADNVYANIGLNWQIMNNLRLSVVYYENRTDAAQPLVVVSPISQPVITQSFRDRGVFLTLRFDARAGRSYAPLGGRPGDGAGRVSGIIYLDANEDGRLEAGEQGAANVTVLLDGRFVARTDAQGRFEFPSVVEGRHVITVIPDNLPLPWALKGDGRTEVNVSVRSSTQVEIPVQRVR